MWFKVCRRCKQRRALSSFSPSRRDEVSLGGFYAWCRKCAADYQRKTYRTLDGQLAHRVRSARARAKRFGVPFDLDVEQPHILWEKQRGRCALSGLELSLDDGAQGKQALRPSLDRVKPERGYIKGNIRLVAAIVNFGINKWGYDTFFEMCRAVVRKKGRRA